MNGNSESRQALGAGGTGRSEARSVLGRVLHRLRSVPVPLDGNEYGNRLSASREDRVLAALNPREHVAEVKPHLLYASQHPFDHIGRVPLPVMLTAQVDRGRRGRHGRRVSFTVAFPVTLTVAFIVQDRQGIGGQR